VTGSDEGISPHLGLTAAEVAERAASGRINVVSTSAGRTIGQILRTNVLTRFNAILGSLFVVVLFVGPLQDGLFGIVLAVNTLVGVAQELRARRILGRLAVLTAPSAHAVRDGRTVELAVTEVVVDDILELRPGDQVVADGHVVLDGGLEVDESLLSGESLPITKHLTDALLSGSVIVAGSATMQVSKVGDDAFAQRLQGDARRFSLVRSELQQGTNRILRIITWVMVPVGLLLVSSQVVRAGQTLDEAIRGSVAGVGAMVPEGLVLLTTIAFALGSIRLAGRRVLVQELAAIEGLARVDVLCIDKTGTLTEPGMHLLEIVPLADGPVREVIGAMAASDPTPNATMLAARAVPSPDGWEVDEVVRFSSSRKWSAVQFHRQGTWVIGAPEIVAPDLAPQHASRIAEHAAMGRRVLMLAHAATSLAGDILPAPVTCAALVVFEERLRPEAERTIAYLQAQGVAVKVLSGDNPATVAAVARRVGVEGADRPGDARDLPEGQGALAEQIEGMTVLGRVQPHQKRDIVAALQANGHVVAMTGDGVNDIPALKIADLGIAMGSGSPATRAVARIVLLDSSFAIVPQILDEGRRVIANVQRVASLFVTKTVYAAILALIVGIAAIPYPFYPRHLTLVSSLTIGIPGFFLALAPGAPRARAGFVERVLRFTLPAGAVAAAATLAAYLVARGPCGASAMQARTTATLTLLVVGLVILGLVSKPLTIPRTLLIAAMTAGAALVWLVPVSRQVFGLVAPPAPAAVAALGIAALAVVPLVMSIRATAPRHKHH
jgi:cation-transporting ATPase E